MSELYETQIIADEIQATDPCGNDPTPGQQVNCAANGVPGGSYVQGDFESNRVAYGGNPQLEPEEGYSFDAGIEFRATDTNSWQASLDFFQTRLDGFIERSDSQLLLDECANFGTPPACSKIRRLPDGSLDAIDTRTSNFGLVRVSGLDLAAQAGVPTRLGDFNFRVLVTNLLTHELQPFEGSQTIDRLGRANVRFALPEWRSLASLGWTRGAWRAQYTVQWIGGFTECGTCIR